MNAIVGRASHRPELQPFPLRGRALLEVIAAYVGLVAAGLAVGFLLTGPLEDTALGRWEIAASDRFERIRTPTWTALTDVGSTLSDTVTIVAATALLVVLLVWLTRRWRESLMVLVGLGLETSVFVTVSVLVGRDRPPIEQLDASPPTASFPSGHTGAALVFYTALALLVFWNSHRPGPRIVATLLAVTVPVIVATSRVYRGMHFVSDVLIGAVLGGVGLALAIGIVARAVERVGGRSVPA